MKFNNIDLSDISKSNPNKHYYRVKDEKIGNIILDDVHENVLTHIFIQKDYRNNGLSRHMINKWLKECFYEKEYKDAYIVGIRSGAIEHVIRTLKRYNYEQVEMSEIPGNIKLGQTVTDLHYKISRK